MLKSKLLLVIYFPADTPVEANGFVGEVKKLMSAHENFADRKVVFALMPGYACTTVKLYADQLGDIEPRDRGKTKPIKDALAECLRNQFGERSTLWFRPEGSKGAFMQYGAN